MTAKTLSNIGLLLSQTNSRSEQLQLLEHAVNIAIRHMNQIGYSGNAIRLKREIQTEVNSESRLENQREIAKTYAAIETKAAVAENLKQIEAQNTIDQIDDDPGMLSIAEIQGRAGRNQR